MLALEDFAFTVGLMASVLSMFIVGKAKLGQLGVLTFY